MSTASSAAHPSLKSAWNHLPQAVGQDVWQVALVGTRLEAGDARGPVGLIGDRLDAGVPKGPEPNFQCIFFYRLVLFMGSTILNQFCCFGIISG